jgi:hypothetical protein
MSGTPLPAENCQLLNGDKIMSNYGRMTIEQAREYGRAYYKRYQARKKLGLDSADPGDFLGDGGEPIPAASVSKILDFLTGKLSDSDMSEFQALLEGSADMGVSTDEDVETEEERQERLARRGLESGGSYGLDAGRHSDRHLDVRKAEAEFRKLFPDAGAVASGFDAASQDERLIHTAKAEAEFRKLFPGAKPLIRV